MEKDGQQVVEIQATPSSNDVVGLQDLYLQLDNSNSTFEMVPDQIASGIDPSASTYTVSSSYSNGNLVRLGGTVNVAETTQTATQTTTTNSSFTGTTSSTTSTVSSGGSGGSTGGGGGY